MRLQSPQNNMDIRSGNETILNCQWSTHILLRDAQKLQEATALLWLTVISPRCFSLR